MIDPQKDNDGRPSWVVKVAKKKPGLMLIQLLKDLVSFVPIQS